MMRPFLSQRMEHVCGTTSNPTVRRSSSNWKNQQAVLSDLVNYYYYLLLLLHCFLFVLVVELPKSQKVKCCECDCVSEMQTDKSQHIRYFGYLSILDLEI